jgi:glycosyltransferase involved in cell wall biosynthesis
VGTVEDQKYYEECRNLAKQLRVENRTIFLGTVTTEQKFYLLSKAMCYVNLACWEADPIAVKEAMSQGLVCIVSNKAGLPFLVNDKENGYVIRTLDEAVEKINLISNSITASKFMVKNNILKAQEFTWDNVAKRFKDVYHKIALGG